MAGLLPLMVSWLPHVAIPLLVALALFPMERRRILWMAPVAWLPDLDYLVPGEHRAVTTNIWIPLGIFLALVWMWRSRDPTARFWEYATRPGHPGHVLLAAYYWASHIFLDTFAGGAVLFWPVLDINFYWFYQIVVNTQTNTFEDHVEVGTEAGAPEVAPTYVWFTGEHHAIFWFLVACALVWALFWWRARRLAPLTVWLPSAIHKDDTQARGRA